MPIRRHSPVNVPNPIQKRFDYGQHTARTGLDCTVPDPTSCIRFGSVLPKKAWVILSKIGLDPLWTARSAFDQTDLVQKSVCIRITGTGSGGTQPARYQFPTFRHVCVVQQTARIIILLRKTSPDPVWFRHTQFWPNGSGPEVSRCARIIRPASGQCFRADPDRM